MPDPAEKTLTLSSLGSLILKRLSEIAREWLLPSREMRRGWGVAAAGLAYIALIAALGGLKSNHILVGLLGLLDVYNENTRRFLRNFYPFILSGVIYDSMRYYYWQGISGHVHVAEPYYRELSWFGIPNWLTGASRRVTPNELFDLHHSVVLDALCGFAYLVFIGQYLLVAFYLFFTKKTQLLRVFAWCFLVVNIFGFITYFVYPAAPPWYVTQYGLGVAHMDVQPYPAATHRFDLLFGTHFFDQIYGNGVDVFGAYPSLHVSYPLMTAWMIFQVPELRWARGPAIGFFLLMCLSAVYLQHHYVVDVLMGMAYAIATVFLVRGYFIRKV